MLIKQCYWCGRSFISLSLDKTFFCADCKKKRIKIPLDKPDILELRKKKIEKIKKIIRNGRQST